MNSRWGGGGKHSGAHQDFELNLASIIDCFTVLIAFMLATASFLSIGLLDAGVAAAGTTASAGDPPQVTLTVELKPDRTISVKTSGKENSSVTLAAKDATWNYDSLTTKLTEIKGRWSGLSAATLVAENTIEYRDVVKTMEVTRRTVPVVLLGGF